MNSSDDPVILGQTYTPNNILVTNEDHLAEIYDELFTMPPVKRLVEFWTKEPDDTLNKVFAYGKEQVCVNLSTLLSFCQGILEIALILEVAEHPDTKHGDFILRDGTLRPIQVKQSY